MSIVNGVMGAAIATGAAAAETAIISNQSDYDHAPSGGMAVRVSGILAVTPGASTTAVVVKVRQGVGVAGTQVGASITHTLAAAANGSVAFDVIDAAPVAGLQYTVTLTQTAGAGAGTVNVATLVTELFPTG